MSGLAPEMPDSAETNFFFGLPENTVSYERRGSKKTTTLSLGVFHSPDFIYYAAHSSCAYCPAGTVRGNAEGTGNTGCSPCAPWQRAYGGKCVDCPSGQVSNDGADSCEYCPAGFERGNREVSAKSDPVCVPAADVCEDNERGYGGKCVGCPAGHVANDDHSSCVY